MARFVRNATLALVALHTLVPGTIVGQQPVGALPEDVESIDGVITALYASISGPTGQERDWDRFKALFHEDARLIPTGINAEGRRRLTVMTPEEYWNGGVPNLSRIGFSETEIGRTIESFGNITHAFSAYASYREDQGDPGTPFSRGINSIQLFHDGDRWWILTVLWDQERDENPIPERYIDRR